MKTEKVTYTHKGWIGFCPVLIGKPESFGPDVDERFPFTGWLLELNLALFEFLVPAQLDEYGWPIRITGKLDAPVTREFEVEA